MVHCAERDLAEDGMLADEKLAGESENFENERLII